MRRMFGAFLSAASYALPLFTDGVFGPKAQAIGVAAGAVLYAFGAKKATDRIEAAQK